MDVLEAAEKLWNGELTVAEQHPFEVSGDLVEVADRTGFLAGFSNVCAFDTDEGLVLVDTGLPLTAGYVHEHLRRWSDRRLHTAVFSHGHIDHVFGVGPFDEESADHGWPRPRVAAHEAMPARFARYRLTAGWNGHINRRQFGVDDIEWPTDYREPDLTYRDRIDLTVGGVRFELHHARGETDDHTWTWVPDRRILCTGDLFIWALPNAGNPQKVQRYPREWAEALREMATLGAEVLLPGHGFPIVGAGRIRQAVMDAAELLESLHDQTVALMNEGATLDRILHTVAAPSHLLAKPYLQPVYDEPEFVVRNVWRLYGGWHDGNPARLQPAADADLAREVAALAGGAVPLASRARELADDGRLRLAGHLAEMARMAGPDRADVLEIHADVYERRRDAAPSTMSKGIFGAAARGSRRALDTPGPGS